jgi:hypothetical protein
VQVAPRDHPILYCSFGSSLDRETHDFEFLQKEMSCDEWMTMPSEDVEESD